MAIEAEIGRRSIFARKNYFYPDLPKGYQISQFELPIVGRGQIEIELEGGERKIVGITRAHLEEDAGKSLHEDFHGMTGIDLNRAGTPLLEIVSEPDLRSPQEAAAYMRTIHALVRYLKISDGNLQEGSFRCDANVSVRPRGQAAFGTRAEIKNINSFRFVERAIEYEVERQIALIESGERVVQETRLYDPDRHETRSMRSKEEANDYRYFPDPDLLPVEIDAATIEAIRAELPELPNAKRQRFMQEYQLSPYDASFLTQSRELAAYFETVVEQSKSEAKLCGNWVMGELSAALNRDSLTIEQSPLSPTALAGLMQRIADNTLSGKLAKQVFEAMWRGEGSADAIIEAQGLKQITDSGALEETITAVLHASHDQVTNYRAADEAKRAKMFGFFVGQVMKATRGKANPAQVNQILKAQLEGSA